jgi:hypothetical protein
MHLPNKLNENQEYADIIQGQIEAYIRSDEGIEFVKNYIEENFEALLDKKQSVALKERLGSVEDEIKDKLDDLNRINGLIDESKATRAELEKKIVHLNEEIERLSDTEAQKEEIQRKIVEIKKEKETVFAELETQIKELTLERDKILSEVTLFKDVMSAEDKKYTLYGVINDLEQDVRQRQEKLRDLDDRILDKNNELLDKINDLAPHIHAVLRGKRRTIQDAELVLMPNSLPVKTTLPDTYAENNDIGQFAADLCMFLAARFEQDYGRSYSPLFVANLLIAMSNSFLTLLYGKPGAGKTSSIRILQGLLNLQNLFLEVNVAKGWDSSRDWIGFYNALQEQFVPSRTGVYQLLNEIQKSKEALPMPLVMLDEANLSTMEHYFAEFIGMADNESKRMLALDGGNSVKVPKTLRFVGTINNDHTTQPLSDRVISRACVINLDNNLHNLYAIDAEIDMESVEGYFKNQAFSADLLQSAFSDGEYRTDSVMENVSDFIDTLNGVDQEAGGVDMTMQHELSNRTKHKIECYAKPAMRIFSLLIAKSTSAISAETLVTDYVLSQFVVPGIRMSGEASKERLINLSYHAESKGYLMTKSLLKTIVSIGSDNLDQFGMFNG